MRSGCGIALALLLSASAQAHRLDEYLQAATIALEKERIQVDIRMIPGALVWPKVLASIDANKDGALSQGEIDVYAERMRRDISLSLNGKALRLRLMSSAFDRAEAFREGLGEIHFRFAADVSVTDTQRRLVFENRHARPIAAYLVNCLAPEDADIRITAQNRNRPQSWYQLDYSQAGAPAGAISKAAER